MNVRYTPEARMDIRAISAYIGGELGNPAAAKRIVDNILKTCSHLKDYPYMGADLAAKTGRETTLRYLACGKHLAFYRVEASKISVVRILDGRTNYMAALFLPEEDGE